MQIKVSSEKNFSGIKKAPIKVLFLLNSDVSYEVLSSGSDNTSAKGFNLAICSDKSCTIQPS